MSPDLDDNAQYHNLLYLETIKDLHQHLGGLLFFSRWLQMSLNLSINLSNWCFHLILQMLCIVGKSLCFQLPALMTGKVVVVVSPLISLMHDQCLQLSRQGVSACFLGSGQVDKTIELKAMAGIFNIVYVCPESLPR